MTKMKWKSSGAKESQLNQQVTVAIGNPEQHVRKASYHGS